MKYAYYPGCSLEATSAAYDTSVRKVAAFLDFQLDEINDWNCCGATEYFTQDRLVAHSVIARNLALVDDDHHQIVAPCSACYLNLKKTDHVMCEHSNVCGQVNEALAAGGLHYEPGSVRVRHLLEIFVDDIGEDEIRRRVVQPLKGLRVAPYYGCQILRPNSDVDNPEYPTKLDQLMAWLGATIVDYPVKGHCCGGHMTQISENQAFELIRRLLKSADDYHADVITCMCPMCQLNLDAYQSQVNAKFSTSYQLPILFFTQLVGVAFGLPLESLGFGKELVSGSPIIEQRLREAQDAKPESPIKKKKSRKKKSKELPMPKAEIGKEDSNA